MPNLSDIPSDLIKYLFYFLPVLSAGRLQQACRRFRRILADNPVICQYHAGKIVRQIVIREENKCFPAIYDQYSGWFFNKFGYSPRSCYLLLKYSCLIAKNNQSVLLMNYCIGWDVTEKKSHNSPHLARCLLKSGKYYNMKSLMLVGKTDHYSFNRIKSLPDELESIRLFYTCENDCVSPNWCDVCRAAPRVTWGSGIGSSPKINISPNITFIKIVRVYMDTLPPEIFTKTTGLTSLEVSSCGLRYLPEEIGECSSLTHVRLHNNNLETIPESMYKLADKNGKNKGYVNRIVLYNNPILYYSRKLSVIKLAIYDPNDSVIIWNICDDMTTSYCMKMLPQ